jgi:hypothetical protein
MNLRLQKKVIFYFIFLWIFFLKIFLILQ